MTKVKAKMRRGVAQSPRKISENILAAGAGKRQIAEGDLYSAWVLCDPIDMTNRKGTSLTEQ